MTEREALKQIAGFTLSQFMGPHDMALACVDIARKALAQPEQIPPSAYSNTHQPQRTWVGLTDEDEINWEDGGSLRDLVKAIEAKLKEKNT